MTSPRRPILAFEKLPEFDRALTEALTRTGNVHSSERQAQDRTKFGVHGDSLSR